MLIDRIDVRIDVKHHFNLGVRDQQISGDVVEELPLRVYFGNFELVPKDLAIVVLLIHFIKSTRICIQLHQPFQQSFSLLQLLANSSKSELLLKELRFLWAGDLRFGPLVPQFKIPLLLSLQAQRALDELAVDGSLQIVILGDGFFLILIFYPLNARHQFSLKRLKVLLTCLLYFSLPPQSVLGDRAGPSGSDVLEDALNLLLTLKLFGVADFVPLIFALRGKRQGSLEDRQPHPG